MTPHRRIPIGIEEFPRIVDPEENYLYCDKTLMCKEFIEDGTQTMLFTRPRRFGKTLNMSMLEHFFGSPKRALFDGLNIAEDQAFMDKHQGQYTVIFLSLKDVKLTNATSTLQAITGLIRECFAPYQALFTAPADRVYFDRDLPMPDETLTRSLRYLAQTLETQIGKPIIILIDEYDAPLQYAYMNGFYDDVAPLIRGLFENTFKTNPYLFKGAFTGVTRIDGPVIASSPSESVAIQTSQGSHHHSGLPRRGVAPPRNDAISLGPLNISVYDIDHTKYSTYFGFTEDEVQAMNLPDYEGVRTWYNGYTFGDATIYNPWSILSYIKNDHLLEAYWLGTGGTDLMEHTLTAEKIPQIHDLMNGISLHLKLNPHIVFDDLLVDPSAFFNLLYIGGYLTADGEAFGDGLDQRLVRIPNLEVLKFYKDVIPKWIDRKARRADRHEGKFVVALMKDLITGNVESVQEKLQRLILQVFSFHDVSAVTQESFYHGFFLGLSLSIQERYVVKSNRESGYGRYDIALYPKNTERDPGVIIEVKLNRSSADEALAQIDGKAYTADLEHHGCKEIYLYGLHFDGKTVSTRLVER